MIFVLRIVIFAYNFSNMELLAPELGLLIWQVLFTLSSLLFLVSWIVILTKENLDTTERLTWMLGTLLLPVIGPVIFFVKQRKLAK
jgi:hypothetical protein